MLLLVGCVKRPVNSEEALTRAIAAVDAAWERRVEGYADVEQALREAQAIDERAPGVAWRWARLELARGTGAPERGDRLIHLGRARELGWVCAFADAGTESIKREDGLERALATLTDDRQLCASWAELAWARWYAEFGADAAALDVEPLTKAAQVALTYPTAGSAQRAAWTLALMEAANGRDSASWNQVQSDVATLDRYRFLSDPADTSKRETIQGSRMTTPEGTAYRKWLLSP